MVMLSDIVVPPDVLGLLFLPVGLVLQIHAATIPCSELNDLELTRPTLNQVVQYRHSYRQSTLRRLGLNPTDDLTLSVEMIV